MSTKPVSSPSQPSASPHVLGHTAVFAPPGVTSRRGGLAIATRAVKEALGRLPPTVRTVAITGTGEPQPGEEFDDMAADLDKGWDAVVSGRPVSEAVKLVEAGWVTGSLERSGLVSIVPPILVDREVLEGVLKDLSEDGWIDPIEAVIAAGGKVGIRSQPR
ncbi:MAG: 2-C-methyl-D-erythritol 4-phosphate cytidylyltransferase [bacterium]|nr:2-C-methyl-D-erythritol 4-phosphate cytidylyltransferase [bacterium]